jgi:hypothetical protein
MKLRLLSIVIGTTLVSLLGHSQRAFSQPKSRVSENIFVFHTDEFWLNLHHFLYVLARAENKESDASREAVVDAPADQERGLAKLSPKEQAIWRKAVASYAAGPSKKDMVFDDPLPAVTKFRRECINSREKGRCAPFEARVEARQRWAGGRNCFAV